MLIALVPKLEKSTKHGSQSICSSPTLRIKKPPISAIVKKKVDVMRILVFAKRTPASAHPASSDNDLDKLL